MEKKSFLIKEWCLDTLKIIPENHLCWMPVSDPIQVCTVYEFRDNDTDKLHVSLWYGQLRLSERPHWLPWLGLGSDVASVLQHIKDITNINYVNRLDTKKIGSQLLPTKCHKFKGWQWLVGSICRSQGSIFKLVEDLQQSATSACEIPLLVVSHL